MGVLEDQADVGLSGCSPRPGSPWRRWLAPDAQLWSGAVVDRRRRAASVASRAEPMLGTGDQCNARDPGLEWVNGHCQGRGTCGPAPRSRRAGWRRSQAAAGSDRQRDLSRSPFPRRRPRETEIHQRSLRTPSCVSLRPQRRSNSARAVHEPSRRSVRRRSVKQISSKVTVQPSPVGDWAWKPT
jgi:hypothetical protein